MRRRAAAWSRAWGMVIAATCIVAGCSLSLRGVGNPVGPFGTPTPFTAGGPPTVEIASPVNGSTRSTGDTIYFDVRGSDPWPVGIARLELFADTTLVARATTSGGANRLSFGALLEWTPLAPGQYAMTAFAYRADGTASPPAMIDLAITGSVITPTPQATATLFTPLPSLSAFPTLTPSPSPTPTLTPSATPAPIPALIDVWVEESELPPWTVGVSSPLIVHVQNIGGTSVPDIRVLARLAGSRGTGRTGHLSPGQHKTLVIALTPESAGVKKLSAEGTLPPGYYDWDPVRNTLLWEMNVIVSSGATDPPPPTATPTNEPTATPDETKGPPGPP